MMIPDFKAPVGVLLAVVSVFLIIRWLSRTSALQICKRWVAFLEDKLHVHNLYKIPQYNDHFQENLLYRKVSTYIKALPSVEDSDLAALYSGDKPGDILVSLGSDQSVTDTFLQVPVTWTYRKRDNDQAGELVLRIKSRDKKRVVAPYIQHIYKVVDEIEQRKRDLRIYFNSSSGNQHGFVNTRWKSFPFVHPSSFDTIVLDNDVKNKVKNDLEQFLKSRVYYNKIGRVWKRSYLLYGSSGTGKSTFAAAMSKFLTYDLYDLDLSQVANDSDLKMLLFQTTRKSLILLENLDLYLMGNSSSVSLTTVLNFMDGVAASHGEERVMVFTMNCKHRIDPLVLRPGRVDVHIHFPLCDFNGFKALALTHLGVTEHKLFGQVEELFQIGSKLSHAEISEIMISNRTSASRAIKCVIMTLQNDKQENINAELNLVEDRLSTSGTGRRHSGELDGPDPRQEGNVALREIQKLYGRIRPSKSRRQASLDLTSSVG